MPELKLALRLANLRVPFKQALPLAAKLGVKAVELDARNMLKPSDLGETALRQIRHMLDDHRLGVSAVTFYTRRGYYDDADLDARIEATRQAMQMAHRLGGRVLVNRVGRVPPDDSKQRKLLVEVLTDLAAYGFRVGAMFAAETGLESGADLAALLRQIPEGTIGADLNPGELVASGFSPREAVEQLGPMILHVHVKDGVRSVSGLRDSEVQLGRGSVDFPELLGTLEDHSYRGYFTIVREQAINPVEEFDDAIAYLKSL